MKVDYTKILKSMFQTSEMWIDFLDSARDSFLLIDSKGVIIYANKSVDEMFGYSKEELIGKKLAVLIPRQYRKKHNEYVQKYFNKPVTRPMSSGHSFNALKKNGSVFFAHISLSSYSTNGNNLILCVVRDATKEFQKLTELTKAKECAENEAKTKSEYLAQMSHEIRSPINIIMNFSGLVREVLNTETQESLKEEFAIISNAGKRVIRTIDLVLNMSEIQSGQFEIAKTNFDLDEEIVKKVYEDFKRIAGSKNLKLFYKRNIKNAEVYADEYCVFQSLMNIVDNAVKYTDKGKIEIIIDRNKEGNIYAEVSDTGIGMSKKYQKDLFKPFHQEYHTFTKKFIGNGLGLALVKKYCDLNEIEILVNSEKGKGSKIRLVFPIYKSKGKAAKEK